MLDEYQSALDPDALGPAIHAAEGAVSDLESGPLSPWCINDWSACTHFGVATTTRAATLDVGGYRGAQLLAKARIAAGDAHPLDDFESACDRTGQRSACLRSLIVLAITTNDKSFTDKSILMLERSGCGVETECSDMQQFLGDVERDSPQSAIPV